MKITFIGTGHGVPANDRYCSSAMIEISNSIYFIDAGAPVMDELLRMNKSINNVRAVFITHCHSDHTSGLLPLSTLLNWYYTSAEVDFFVPEEQITEAVNVWSLANHGSRLDESRVRYKVFSEGTVYEDENLIVSAFPTLHLQRKDAPAYGFTVTDKSSGKRIVFSGDLSHNLALADFPAIAMSENIDALVCEMAHFKLSDVAPYLEKCTARALYFNHVYPLSKLSDIEKANGSYPFPMYVLRDRDEILL